MSSNSPAESNTKPAVSEPENKVKLAQQAALFAVGDRLVIHGLQSKVGQALNAQLVTVYNPGSVVKDDEVRFYCKFDDRTIKKVKPSNLLRVDTLNTPKKIAKAQMKYIEALKSTGVTIDEAMRIAAREMNKIAAALNKEQEETNGSQCYGCKRKLNGRDPFGNLHVVPNDQCPDCLVTVCEMCQYSPRTGMCRCIGGVRGDYFCDALDRPFIQSTFRYKGPFKCMAQCSLERNLANPILTKGTLRRIKRCSNDCCGENVGKRPLKLTNDNINQFVMCGICKSAAYCSNECMKEAKDKKVPHMYLDYKNVSHRDICGMYLRNETTDVPGTSKWLKKYNNKYERYPHPLGGVQPAGPVGKPRTNKVVSDGGGGSRLFDVYCISNTSDTYAHTHHPGHPAGNHIGMGVSSTLLISPSKTSAADPDTFTKASSLPMAYKQQYLKDLLDTYGGDFVAMCAKCRVFDEKDVNNERSQAILFVVEHFNINNEWSIGPSPHSLYAKRQFINQLQESTKGGDYEASALSMAAIVENVSLVTYLLQNYADVALETKEGTNVFHMSCYFNTRSLETMKLLVESAQKRGLLAGALNAIDNYGETPLVRAYLQMREKSESGKDNALKFQFELIEYLQELGATRYSDY